MSGSQAPIRALLIEDNAGDTRLIREMLRDASPDGFELIRADRLSEGIACLLAEGADCILLDLSLPDAEGLDALAQIRTVALDVPIVVLSGRSDETLAVRAVQEGAQDYLIKGQVDARLPFLGADLAFQGNCFDLRKIAHEILRCLPYYACGTQGGEP